MSSTSRRRLLLALIPSSIAAAAAKPASCPPPTDDIPLNHFAALYNRYVEQLRHGQIDMRLWRQAATAWRKLCPHTEG